MEQQPLDELSDLRRRVAELEKTLLQMSAFSNPNTFFVKFTSFWMPLIIALAFTGLLAFNFWNAWHMWPTLTEINKMSVFVMNSPLMVFAGVSYIQFFFNPVTAVKKLLG